jgi:hypothetical protein
MQPFAGADGLEQAHRTLLQHAGSDARQHVGAILALDDDGIDAARMQQLSEQQPGRSGADDGDLGAQNVSSRRLPPFSAAIFGTGLV